ncbi:MAG: ABC transporter ATP-binding protein [Bacilli bacterium]
MSDISLRNVSVTYTSNKEKTVALDDINVTFKDGDFCALIGPSGSGKTTLGKVVLGLLDYKGNIYFSSLNANNISVDERNFGYIPQEYILYPHMTIFDNIAFPLKMNNAKKEEIVERVYALADELNITHLLSRKPRYLSGGQKQCVALARALIKKPSFIVFDEPLANFDTPTRMEVRMLIRKALKARNIGAIYITHDISEALAISDRIYVIDKGKIVLEDTPINVFNSSLPVVNDLKSIIDYDRDI